MSAAGGGGPRERELEALRARAEAQLGAAEGADEARRLLHELSVYQAELAMQNDELRRSQVSLDESRARWHELFEEGPLAALTVGVDGLVQEFNGAAVALLGGRDQLRGRAFSRLAAPGHEITLQRALASALAGRRSGSAEVEVRGPGGPILAEVNAAPVGAPSAARILVFLRDLTERRHGEEDRRRLAGQVERLQRLDALGRMAGAVAHEINNVLAVVMGGAAAAAETWQGQPPGAEFEEILAAARRGRELTQRLLGFARPTPAHLETIHAGALAHEVASFLRKVSGAVDRIEVVEEVAPGEAVVSGDPTQLHQALLNLGLNACDAMGERGGGLVFRIGLVEVDAAEASRRPGLAVGRHVRIAVEDDGPGFTSEAASRAFEPFFTTKAAGKGTGLGLAMVLGVARDHHGAAGIVERAGPGATVELLLPLAQPVAAVPAVLAPAPRRSGAGGLALVIDDEPGVARALGRLLGRRGWKVVAAGSGPEGVARFAEQGSQVGIIFLDLLMPGMGGVEVLGRLRTLDPEVPVVLSSGYTHERVPAAVLSHPRTRFMAKPFEASELDGLLELLARHEGSLQPRSA